MRARDFLRLLQIRMAQSQGVDSRLWWTLVVTTHPSAAQVVDMDLRNRALSLGQLRGCSLFHSSIKQIPNSIPVPLPCLGQLFALLEQSFCAGNFLAAALPASKFRCPRNPNSVEPKEPKPKPKPKNPSTSPSSRYILCSHLDTHTTRLRFVYVLALCMCVSVCISARTPRRSRVHYTINSNSNLP